MEYRKSLSGMSSACLAGIIGNGHAVAAAAARRKRLFRVAYEVDVCDFNCVQTGIIRLVGTGKKYLCRAERAFRASAETSSLSRYFAAGVREGSVVVRAFSTWGKCGNAP